MEKSRPNPYDTRPRSLCEREARSTVAVRYTIAPLRFRPPPRVPQDLVANQKVIVPLEHLLDAYRTAPLRSQTPFALSRGLVISA